VVPLYIIAVMLTLTSIFYRCMSIIRNLNVKPLLIHPVCILLVVGLVVVALQETICDFHIILAP